MNKEKKRNDLYKSTETNKTPINDSSTNISPFSMEISKTTSKKLNNYQKDKNLLKNDYISKTIPFNEQFSSKENNDNNLKNILINLEKKLSNLDNNINLNTKTIENLKSSLNKLKLEKNNKKQNIVNLLSNKESLDEIYNNYIDYLKNKNKGNIVNNKKFNNIKSNPLDNQDEDAFEILISEIKEIDVNKFIEQAFNLIEEIFDNPNQQLKISLKEIINKSYSLFNNAISSSPFLDTYSIVSNFFLRISIFLSNESNGKYSETIINLFLRCLVKMNSINEKNEKLINYMNTKYKEDKGKIKEEIASLVNKNEVLEKRKTLLEKQIKELEIQLKNKNIQVPDFGSINNNINKSADCDNRNNSNNENISNNTLIYSESKKDKNLISKYKNDNTNKKNEVTEKLKNKCKKIYKEDIIEIEKHEDIINENNINLNYTENYNDSLNINNDSNKINYETQLIESNRKSYDNFIDKINKNELNDKNDVNINEMIKEKEKENIFDIKYINYGKNKNYKNYNTTKSNKHKDEENKDILIRKIDKTNIKKYNTINNYHGISKKNISKKEYISPQVNNKIQTVYKDNIIEKNNNNYNPKVLERIYYNKKFKVNHKEPKKKLNYHNYTKKINNNIISYNDINKNMKCDLAKKIKYLDKVNKNNTNSSIQSKNLSKNNKNNKNKLINDQNVKFKRLLTEKKEKKFNYNFFDIIQETNKKRNNSGENKFKALNNLNNSSNFRNSIRDKFEKEKSLYKEINEKYKLTNKTYEHLVKSDFINDRIKSFYDKNNFLINLNNISNTKKIKNGIENETNYNNGCDSPFSKRNNKGNDNKNKAKNLNMINKNIKPEVNSYTKINILNNRNQYYHINKNTYNNNNNSGKKENMVDGYKFQSFKRENNLPQVLNKENKKNNNIYFIITESRYNIKKNNRIIDKLNKNENINDQNSTSKSNRRVDISKNKNIDKGFNSCSKVQKNVSNFNYKYNNTLLLKRSLSSTINKLLNNNLKKKTMIDSYNENYNNNSSSNNSFNISNSLGVSYISNNKKGKEIVSYNDNYNKPKNNKESITNLKIGLKNKDENQKEFNRNKKSNLNKILKVSTSNLINNDYSSLLSQFKNNQKETFCYFKIFENDFKNNKKFNPLENCSINPESLGYSEGYISIDINENMIKINPKNINRISSNTNIIENEQLSKNNSKMNENNKLNSIINKDYCLNIELKEIIDINQSLIMNNIIKIHSIFIKYNSGQNNNYINNSSQKSELLNLNKLIYLREIKEIIMPQNEKIKAALCNYFSFSLLFGKYDKIEIELIFINFEQYNLWNNYINSIIEINKNNINYNKKDIIERKISSNNSKDYTHNKGTIENGSNVNEDISKLSNDVILNL